MNRPRLFLCALSLLLFSGCNVRTYCFECMFDASAPDAAVESGVRDAAVDAEDASSCSGPELCNGVDDDCDGVDDEHDPDIDGVDDVCSASSAGLCGGALKCVAGTTDGRLTCVGAITPSAEICDGMDNDCDGFVDETLDDEAHEYRAGAGGPCWQLADGTEVPHAGACSPGVWACDSTLHRLVCDGTVGPVVERCDLNDAARNVDDDCDGTIDEGEYDESGAATEDANAFFCTLERGSATIPGHRICANGQFACISNTAPSTEICDGADNDLDGAIDENILDRDVNNCGECGHACTSEDAFRNAEHVNIRCVDMTPGDMEERGTCVLDSTMPCASNYYDVDRNPLNGCEYNCVLNGVELCNGRDDDCDGNVDEEADIGSTRPDFCVKVGPCATMAATCSGTDGWVCDYEAFGEANDLRIDVVTDERGRQSLRSGGELWCDGVDNNCNGATDETFPTLTQSCTRGIGACTTSGTIQCLADGSDVYCNAAEPPDYSSRLETCNSVDDDCDGETDEGDLDDWIVISRTYRIYKYEASRPDGTATVLGAESARACSIANRLPWINVTYEQAEAACQALHVPGARLCSPAEWKQACGGFYGCPYGMLTSSEDGLRQCTYETDVCNDGSHDVNPMLSSVQNGLLATGHMDACYSSWFDHEIGAEGDFNIHDLTGNVSEWTRASGGVATIYGGSYTSPPGEGLMCNNEFFSTTLLSGQDALAFGTIGFRCCADAL